MPPENGFALTCPTPPAAPPLILLAHGGGGRLMQRLLEQVIVPAFRNPILEERHDSASLALPVPAPRLAFTTDSYVVRPLFFPGGDIGTLAVNGTVNDLAMGGARPLWLSAAFILEEGLPLETLRQVTASMRRAADAAGVQIVTGDTKVVDRGKGDGIFITASGIGVVEQEQVPGPRQVRPGDRILLSGDLGRHGMAIMAAREGIAFEGLLESDCAALARPVLALLEAGIALHCLRDLTRGGLASALVEIAETAGLSFRIHEEDIPVQESVQAACELLGFDPLHVACEGRFIAFVPPGQAEPALAVLRRDPLGTGCRIIGSVVEQEPGLVTLRSRIGANRVVDMLSGELLPRIC
jgi:hydrogenase expression/formation protein HypE